MPTAFAASGSGPVGSQTPTTSTKQSIEALLSGHYCKWADSSASLRKASSMLLFLATVVSIAASAVFVRPISNAMAVAVVVESPRRRPARSFEAARDKTSFDGWSFGTDWSFA